MSRPGDLAESAELAARVRGAVLRLPPGQRSAVIGFYLSGLSATGRPPLSSGSGSRRSGPASQGKGRPSGRPPIALGCAGHGYDDLVEMRIADVGRGPADAEPVSYFVLLDEINGALRLPIWIGPHEGMVLAWLLEQLELPRPLGPQFMFSALQAVRARVVEVRIDRLAERTFFAVAVIEGPSGAVEVDARPSDALRTQLLRLQATAVLVLVDGEPLYPQRAPRPGIEWGGISRTCDPFAYREPAGVLLHHATHTAQSLRLLLEAGVRGGDVAGRRLTYGLPRTSSDPGRRRA